MLDADNKTFVVHDYLGVRKVVSVFKKIDLDLRQDPVWSLNVR